MHRLMLLQTRHHFRRQHKARTVLSRQFRTPLGKRIHALAIDELQRAACPGRKTDAEDRTDVAVMHRGQHAFLQAAGGLDCLAVQQAVFDVLLDALIDQKQPLLLGGCNLHPIGLGKSEDHFANDLALRSGELQKGVKCFTL
jgi:hypothetical protein